MYKSIVNELALCDTIEIKVRSSEGAEIVLQVKSEEKFSKLKEEIWRNIGTKTQLKIGDAIVDIMTEYIQSTELSYDAFGALPEAEQVYFLAPTAAQGVTIFVLSCVYPSLWFKFVNVKLSIFIFQLRF